MPDQRLSAFVTLIAAAFPLSAQQFEEPYKRHWPTGAVQVHDFALVDIDGDGDLDALTAAYQGNAMHRNDGRARFAQPEAIPGQLWQNEAMLAADFDGDGLQDLIAFGIGTASYGDYLWRNVGGAFVPWGQLPYSYGRSHGYAAGDVDGDGDLDLVIARSHAAGAPNRVYRNDGNGSFTDITTAGVNTFGSTAAVALGDVDGDGDLDAVFADFPQCTLWLNDGLGNFQDATSQLPFDQLVDRAVVMADFDGDLDLDVMIGSSSGPPRHYRNDGAGNFTDVTAATLPADSSEVYAIAVGDVEGDGDLDVFLARFQQRDVMLRNDGAGNFVAAPRSHGDFDLFLSTSARFGDLDGDGDLDLAVATMDAAGGHQDHVYVNVGAGRFVSGSARAVPTRPEASTAVAVADFDGDGRLDLLFAQEHDGEAALLLADGSGGYQDVSATALPGLPADAKGLAIGDVDGDGDIDIVLACYRQPNRLYRNDGSGVFVADPSFPSDTDRTMCCAIADVDGDGDLDVVFGASGQLSADPNRLYLNDGTGIFTDVSTTHLPPLGSFCNGVAFGDVDGDGDPDLALANTGIPGITGGSNMLCLNDGTGRFTNVTGIRMPTDQTMSNAVAFSDLDGDGDLDLLFGNGNSFLGEANLCYRNDGTGSFSNASASWLPPDVDSTYGIVCGDVDGDGDVDVFVANRYDPAAVTESRLYYNDGTGVLAEVPGRWTPTAQHGAAAAMHDLDADDDLDLVLAVGYYGGAAQDRVLANRTRHAAAPFLLRTGDSWPLELHAEPLPAGGPQFVVPMLALQPAPAPVALPFAGTLQLDPAGVVLLAPIALSNGDATIMLQVPAATGIVGVELRAQPLFLGGGTFADWGFGNAVVERVVE